MAWKPSRSSGIVYDTYSEKSEKHREQMKQLLLTCNPPKFSDLNKISKCVYLYYLNDNKAIAAIKGKERKFEEYCPTYWLSIFKRNPLYLYKPLQPLIHALNNADSIAV